MGASRFESAWLLSLAASLCACGGHVQSSAPDMGVAVGGSDGIAAASGNTGVAAMSGGDATTSGGSSAIAGDGGSLTPSPSGNGEPGDCLPLPDAACLAQQIPLFSPPPTPGVWVETLQRPAYGVRPTGYYPPSVDPDPATWDRSPMPAGACVFRIHGLSPNCQSAGILWQDSCNREDLIGGPHVPIPSYYEAGVCMRHITPGCPTADPWNAAGYWWYMQPDGKDVDVVVCAPECASSIANHGGCLELPGRMPTP